VSASEPPVDPAAPDGVAVEPGASEAQASAPPPAAWPETAPPANWGMPGSALPSATGDQAGGAADALAGRPEIGVGLAFAGGLLVATLLKRLGS
jgi:hypothetical protein